MTVYRRVHISFWQDPDVLELTPEQKYFYLYLMTNSKTRQCGCYEISKKVMQLETGYNSETIDKLIDIFIELGKIEYCKNTGEILLKNWYKHNNSSSVKVKTCVTNEVATIKHEPFKKYCIDTLLIDYTYSMDTETQKEKEKEKEKEKREDVNNFFESIWQLYPRKVGKGQISDKKKKELHSYGYDVIKQCIDRYKKDKKEWQEWKHGSTFFNSGFIDYLDENYSPESDEENKMPNYTGATDEELYGGD